jgi:hypothetical protein
VADIHKSVAKKFIRIMSSSVGYTIPPIEELKNIDFNKKCGKSWLFLTYIRTSFSLEKSTISMTMLLKGADKYLISEEIGSEHGTKHHHVIVHSSKRFTLRHSKHFDIQTSQGNTIHPNIFEFSKSDLTKVIAYSLKEDSDPETHNFDNEMRSYIAQITKKTFTRTTTASDIYTLIENCETRQQAMSIVSERVPYNFFPQAKSIVESKIPERKKNTSYRERGEFPRSDYNFPPIILEMFEKVILQDSMMTRHPAILITGPSGVGKSLSIASLGPHLYFRQQVNWKNIHSCSIEGAKFIIYDDIKPSHLEILAHNKALLCGMHGGFDLDIKHDNENKVDINIPSIIVSNEPPRWVKDKYWKNNLLWIEIETSMCKADNEILSYNILNVPTVKYKNIPKTPEFKYPDFSELQVKTLVNTDDWE